MVNYMIDGWDQDHGVPAGPMTPVVDHLARLPEDEIYAIAAYIASLQARPDADRAALLDQARALEYGGAAFKAAAPADAPYQPVDEVGCG